MLLGSLMIGVCDWWSTESRSFARLEELWCEGGWDSSSTFLGPVGGRFAFQARPSLTKAGLPPRTKSEVRFFVPRWSYYSSMAILSGPSSERRLRGRALFCKLRGAVGHCLLKQPPQAVTRQVQGRRINV